MSQSNLSSGGWAFVRQRFVLWLVITVVFTAWLVQYSISQGRVALDMDYDDIVYCNDGLDRLDILYNQGWIGFIQEYYRDPPHAPFSTLVAVLSFGVFGVHEWAPYAGNGILIFLAIAFTDYLLRTVRPWQRWFCFILVGSFPLMEGAVSEFRPDFAAGLLTAMGIVLILKESLTASSWRRRACAGICFGLALVAKPSACPFTLVMLAGSLTLASLCDLLLRMKRSATIAPPEHGLGLRRHIVCWASCLAPAILVALPHYLVAHQHIRAYIYMVLFSSEAEQLRLAGGRPFSPWYHLTGLGGRMMLGFHLYIVYAVLLVGIACLIFNRMWERLLRMGALGCMLVVAFLIPSSTRIENPFFDLTFLVLLVFTVVMLLGVLLDVEQTVLANRTGEDWPVWRRFLAWGYRFRWATVACLVAAIVGLADSLPLRPVYSKRGDPASSSRHDVHVAIVNSLRQQMKPNKKPRVFVTTLSLAVNNSILAWHARKAGFTCTFYDDALSGDLDRQQKHFDDADYVLTTVATSERGKAWVELHPSGKVAGELDRIIRSRQDFTETGSYSFMGDVKYTLFTRKGLFDGYKDKEGLCPDEGPYPQWNLPIVRWGVGYDTRLEFESKKDAPMRLLICGRPGVPDQALTVLLDGERIHEHTFAGNLAEFINLDIPMQVTSGVHELTLHYAACDETGRGARVNVLYKQLQIVPDKKAMVRLPGEQE